MADYRGRNAVGGVDSAWDRIGESGRAFGDVAYLDNCFLHIGDLVSYASIASFNVFAVKKSVINDKFLEAVNPYAHLLRLPVSWVAFLIDFGVVLAKDILEVVQQIFHFVCHDFSIFFLYKRIFTMRLFDWAGIVGAMPWVRNTWSWERWPLRYLPPV